MKKSRQTAEFGDFQTPIELARGCCKLLERRRLKPASVVEPTCGTGNFLIAALDQFENVKKAVGLDINPAYVEATTSVLRRRPYFKKVQIIRGNFFETDWDTLLQGLPEPFLVVGNPPWVTSAELGTLGSSNLPEKSNFLGFVGLDALMGKSNFDISEWMLLRVLEWIDGRRATMAMLCKTAVARKILIHAWKNDMSLERADIVLIDAGEHFGAAVDACFLVCRSSPSAHSRDCSVYKSISSRKAAHTIGYRDGKLIAEVPLYDRWKHLQGKEVYKWRSGVKHDCAKVMELHREGTRYRNGLKELVELEDEYVFPMLKSSDLANGRTGQPRRFMLVTQRMIGEDTGGIENRAPKTWRYLQSHAEVLDRRASTIYKTRPQFSIFGVGPYSFAPWKVAISGFYKKLDFKVIGSAHEKPIVLDDTSYFIPCETKEEAEYLASMLNSSIAEEFFRAFIFWDAKRPITVDVLRRLDMAELARELGTEATLKQYLSRKSSRHNKNASSLRLQEELFDHARAGT